jgi:hypothetical protein
MATTYVTDLTAAPLFELLRNLGRLRELQEYNAQQGNVRDLDTAWRVAAITLEIVTRVRNANGQCIGARAYVDAEGDLHAYGCIGAVGEIEEIRGPAPHEITTWVCDECGRPTGRVSIEWWGEHPHSVEIGPESARRPEIGLVDMVGG